MPKKLGREKQDTHSFWLSLLSDVFGIEGAYRRFIDFEKKIFLPDKHVGYIDGYIADTKVLIEQKSRGISLEDRALQSDGSELNPYEQAQRYAAALNLEEQPRWIITCNFDEFRIYDQNDKQADPVIVTLDKFDEGFRSLSVIADRDADAVPHEVQLSVAAGGLIGKLYKALRVQYGNKIPEEEIDRSLNVLCVRLAFCLYAEDSGLFGRHAMFHDYLRQSMVEDMRDALIFLFKVLNTPVNQRDPYLKKSLAEFPYVNGGLFSDQTIKIPQINEEVADLLLKEASEGFDWKNISPTIFGAVFESTLNPETQRKGGMHYTSVENIHKVIDPLFLNDLRDEYREILSKYKDLKKRKENLQKFQKKLGELTFLDPACGSGNFLTETYLSLRRLENEVLRVITHGQQALDFSAIQVHIKQFYGIEINDFAVTVAKTALWIAEHQMLQETEDIVHQNMDFLPLKSYSNIVEGNALRIEWDNVVSRKKVNFIIGNPPFIGSKMMNEEQKNDLVNVLGKIRIANSLDYVVGWFFKAARFIQGTNARAGLVATSSISQGEHVAPVWSEMTGRYGMKIDYAYRNFRWDSESDNVAHVHVVIIGFSDKAVITDKKLYDECGNKVNVSNVNGYLIDAPEIYVEKRSTPICDVPNIDYGSMPNDGGNFILTKEEADSILKKHPNFKIYIKKFIGATEFINGKVRYCLWLKNASPEDIQSCPDVFKRVMAVRELRLKSSAAPTREKAKIPHLFFYCSHPDSDYLLIPSTSSEKRKYVPIGFEHADTVASNACSIVPNATLYHFGVVTSRVHMAWMRAIAGRLKSDYRYSGSVVYTTFPWPDSTQAQKETISDCAKKILDARDAHSKKSLADLYGEGMILYNDLVSAHEANDEAVLAAYGLKRDASESEIVSHLMKRYVEKLAEVEQAAAEEAKRLKKEKAEARTAERERRKAERAAAKTAAKDKAAR